MAGSKPKDSEQAVNQERAVVLHQDKDSDKEEELAGKAKTPIIIKS